MNRRQFLETSGAARMPAAECPLVLRRHVGQGFVETAVEFRNLFDDPATRGFGRN